MSMTAPMGPANMRTALASLLIVLAVLRRSPTTRFKSCALHEPLGVGYGRRLGVHCD
jgi:hypothetical protein